MADEESKHEESKHQEGSSGSNKVVIIIGVVVLVLLLIIGGIVAVLLSGDDNSGAPSAQVAMQNAPALLGNTDNESLPDIKVDRTYLKVGPLFELPLFVANLISRKGKRYLRVKINFEMDNEALQDELTTKQAIISDIVLGILTSKTVEDLMSIKGKSRTKQEMIVTLNKSLLDGKIKNIFFTEFIIQ
jgi:flagellar FliL protein